MDLQRQVSFDMYIWREGQALHAYTTGGVATGAAEAELKARIARKACSERRRRVEEMAAECAMLPLLLASA